MKSLETPWPITCMRLGHWGQASKVLEYAIHIHVCRWIFHLNYNYWQNTSYSPPFMHSQLFFIACLCFWGFLGFFYSLDLLTKFLPCKYFLIFKKFWGALMDLKNKIRLHTVDIFTCTSMHIIKSRPRSIRTIFKKYAISGKKPSNFVLSSWH